MVTTFIPYVIDLRWIATKLNYIAGSIKKYTCDYAERVTLRSKFDYKVVNI